MAVDSPDPGEYVAESAPGWGWWLAVSGLALLVTSIVALSGPGRIDIIDGQARYLVAQALVDHGEPTIRDETFWFSVLPGRDGKRFSSYRCPHILAGVPAILLADATGPEAETRREFFFTQVGAVVAGVMAVVYALWFRALGHSPAQALGWALAGIVCTPSWYYATSTFDDILGTLFVVSAVASAWWAGRGCRPLLGATTAGLLIGLAFNSKPPLAIVVLPALALVLTAQRPWPMRIGSGALIVGGLALGLVAYEAYEWYKFPPETRAAHASLLAVYLPAWPGNTAAGLCGLLLSPAAGVFWYCPTLLLSLYGLVRWRQGEPWFCAGMAIAAAVFVAFISTMSFYKGDLSWGPRYLTPIFALLWLFAPAAAAAWPRRLTAGLLTLGLVVQLLGLSVDPLRLYVTHRLPSGYFGGREWIHFEPELSHLVTRPREILEIWQDDGTGTTAFCADPLPTSTRLLLEEIDNGPEAVRKYRYLSSYRPWWVSQAWLSPADRPVVLGESVRLLLLGAGIGIMLIGTGLALRVRSTGSPAGVHA